MCDTLILHTLKWGLVPEVVLAEMRAQTTGSSAVMLSQLELLQLETVLLYINAYSLCWRGSALTTKLWRYFVSLAQYKVVTYKKRNYFSMKEMEVQAL